MFQKLFKYIYSKSNLLVLIISISLIGYNKWYYNNNVTINWSILQKMIVNNTQINKIDMIDENTAYIYSNKKYILYTPYIDYIEKNLENLDKLIEHKIPINYIKSYSYLSLTNLYYLIGICLLVKLLFLNTNKSLYDIKENISIEKTTTKMEDVAGLFNSKQELLDLLEIFINFEKYQKLGAKIPKGALLEGPPGTGKTMLARAIANKYDMNFILCSGSDLIKPIVGTGSIQVKEIFKNARLKAPSILFIDEIDAIGRSRDSNAYSSMNERENILNSLLVELDGFEANDKVFTIAATNRVDILDKALIRPGRFDRCITFSLPHLEERKDILNTYFNKMSLSIEKDKLLHDLSFETYGFSGADLENLCNEAAIYAGKENKDTVSTIDFRQAIDYINMGSEIYYKLQPEEKHIVSIHESGHALVSYLLNDSNKPTLITIIPRTKGALGFTKILPEYDKKLYNYEDYFNQICVLLGGRIAEKIILGKITNGAYDDIQKVNKIAREMITKMGMSTEETLSNIIIENKQQDFYKYHSEKLSQDYDNRIIELIKKCETKVNYILEENKDKLLKLSKLLEEKEILYQEDINQILEP